MFAKQTISFLKPRPDGGRGRGGGSAHPTLSNFMMGVSCSSLELGFTHFQAKIFVSVFVFSLPFSHQNIQYLLPISDDTYIDTNFHNERTEETYTHEGHT